MARARDIASVLRVALVWLLVIVAVPFGGGPRSSLPGADACASWCPCDTAADADCDGDCDGDCDADGDCDEDCDESCDGCCDARAPVAIGLEQLPGTFLRAVPTRGPPCLDAPGCRVATAVFRPPRSLS